MPLNPFVVGYFTKGRGGLLGCLRWNAGLIREYLLVGVWLVGKQAVLTWFRILCFCP